MVIISMAIENNLKLMVGFSMEGVVGFSWIWRVWREVREIGGVEAMTKIVVPGAGILWDNKLCNIWNKTPVGNHRIEMPFMNSHKLILKDPKIKNHLFRVKRINPHNNNKNNHKVVIKLTPFLKWMFYKPNPFPRAKNRYNITPNHQLINCKLNHMRIMNKLLHNFFRLIKRMFNI